ncbi:MAG: ABC transporter permease [Cellulomonadaceae bacterium]|jgi:ABC-2 type transport system permease protein|nr:ABC transporter permease [Cellulomonadaceae bacterium]
MTTLPTSSSATGTAVTAAPAAANQSVATPATTPTPQNLGYLQSIWLIAEREITTRAKQKSFRILTAVLVLAVVLSMVVIHLVAGEITSTTIATTNPTTSTVVEHAMTASEVDVTVSTVTDESAAKDKVTAGDLDALVVPAADGSLEVFVDTRIDPTVAAVLNGVAQQQALAVQVSNLGGDPAAVSAAVGTAHATVTPLGQPDDQDAGQLIAGMMVGILMAISIMLSAQYVAQGVVEEKTSRVVELLLSTVKPTQLMAGKVLGIGLLGLLQVALVVGAAAVTSHFTGVLDTSALQMGPLVAWALVWFIVGYAIFSLIIAALAALVSRQEEVGSVTMPVTVFMMIPYMVGISVLPQDPTNHFATVLSYVPGASSLLMPIRDSLGVVSVPQQLIALAIAIAVIPLLVWVAGRIYSNAVLRTGGRIKLKDAFAGS